MTLLLLGSSIGAKGAWTSRELDPTCAAGLAAGASSANPKRWACEDSLAVQREPDGAWLAAVADAHFGGSSGESVAAGLAQAWARAAGAPGGQPARGALARLRAALVLVDAHLWAQARPDDPSETTALLVHVDARARRVAWANVGDSLLVVVDAAGAARRLNATRADFIGRVPLAVQRPPDAGEAALAAGDLVLLATDGLEAWVSDLDLPDVGRRLRAAGSPRAGVDDLLRHQSAQGRDNLGVVLLQA